MFGLDRAPWLIPLVLLVVLVLWGPSKLPEVGAGLGRAIREFRGAISGMKEPVAEAAPAAVAATAVTHPVPVAAATTAAVSPVGATADETNNRH
jgi:TatA/E family protein of Tat protein translocase